MQGQGLPLTQRTTGQIKAAEYLFHNASKKRNLRNKIIRSIYWNIYIMTEREISRKDYIKEMNHVQFSSDGNSKIRQGLPRTISIFNKKKSQYKDT